YIYATDTARAALQIYRCPEARGRVVNIGSGQEISIMALKTKIEHILGRAIPTEHRQPRPGDVRRHQADITLLKSLVPFEPQVTLDAGLLKTVEFYRQRYQTMTGES
ncbi:MAG: hypothetical protein M3Z08_04105, partial [Chloroflexota bacterium]|nr:hypothetical protein [Chloroflexota bacterium]